MRSRYRGVAANFVHLVTAGCLVLSTGCGSRFAPVHGKVTLPGGAPASGSLVVFESEGNGKTITARGEVQADGSYQLGTVEPGDGAPPGKYHALVAPPAVTNADAPTRSPFSAKFSAFQTSGLEFEVQANKDNEFPIQLAK